MSLSVRVPGVAKFASQLGPDPFLASFLSHKARTALFPARGFLYFIATPVLLNRASRYRYLLYPPSGVCGRGYVPPSFKHLSMCNDYGSAMRDRAEGNLNSPGFLEFRRLGTGQDNQRRPERARKEMRDGPMWIAEYKRRCVNAAITQMSQFTG
ncbi:hypothetical protein F5Y10DRAFT_291411 [Nemania abortiva]|nr:hypothetical protein F5Y10DRAFT_291411 [Nemania abortiva]